MSYADFLQTKERRAHRVGDIPNDIHPFLHDWQREVVQWACGVGRAAIWADTGLGKTVMQLEWARHMAGPGGRALVVAPLAVCHQTSREARNRIDLHAEYTRDGDGLGPGVWITNYEMLPHFNPHDFNAIVLDEASILKSSDGKTRTALIEWASAVPYRLSCTATPAPNDPEELTNQAEFLGQMSRVHMLAGYYVHDDTGWRLKGHAHRPMLEWMATWAIALRTPSDIGGEDDGYILPGLEIKSTLVPVAVDSGDQLFATELGGVQGRAAIRKQTLGARVQAAADIINAEPDEAWLIWCGLNAEADAIAKAVPGAMNVHGALTPEEKALGALWFAGDACVCGVSFGGKLASWQLETIPTTSANTTPPTVSEKFRALGSGSKTTPSIDASTCVTTTNGTRPSSSAPGLQKSEIATTRAGASVTPMTPNTEKKRNSLSGRSTPKSGETRGCVPNLELESQSSTPCSNLRTTGAQSAAQRLATMLVDGSPSTTVMNPEELGDFSAGHATSDSANSQTTPNVLNARHCTCGYISGRRVLVSKTSILGMGMNWQHCARMIFVGLSDSYEQYYQAIRRCYRYGQTRVVDAHIVLSEIEGQIANNVARKEREASHITDGLVSEMRRARGLQENAS